MAGVHSRQMAKIFASFVVLHVSRINAQPIGTDSLWHLWCSCYGSGFSDFCPPPTPPPPPPPPPPSPPQPVEDVFCSFTIDNEVTDAYVDGVKVYIENSENMAAWNTLKQIQFVSSARELVIAGLDYENGCSSGGLLLACSSTDPNWNAVRSHTSGWKARAQAGAPAGWELTGYDDSNWSDAVTTDLHAAWALDTFGTPVTPVCAAGTTHWLFRYTHTNPDFPAPPPPPSVVSVTCNVIADNAISQAWVDGIRAELIGDSLWTSPKSFTFDSTAKGFALVANDFEDGCSSGGVAVSCVSSDPGWDAVRSSTSDGNWKVAAGTADQLPAGWTHPDFDDSTWIAPSEGASVEAYLPSNSDGADGLCGPTTQWGFRYTHPI
mmetsp:Transcript_11822/g.38858  ORF Transcript_11822/g.38858 Transcript_11822/m.38858 type:complete len:378 (-) Transcript_11822:3649-4782(-)